MTKNQLVRKSYTIGSDYTNKNKFITVINRNTNKFQFNNCNFTSAYTTTL